MGAAVLLLCVSFIFYKRRDNKKRTPFRRHDKQVLKRYDLGGDNGTSPASIETFLHNYTLGRPTRFSYKQLKKYTNNFSYKIGQGGFGSVFKGQLPSSFTIAVKVLDVATEKRWVFNHHVMNASSGEDSGNMDNGRVVDSKWHTCEGKEEKDMAMRMELVGLWCIQFEPSKRPSMRKVVDMLEGNVVIEIPSAPFDGRFPGSVWRNNVPIVQQLETTSSIEITQSSEYLQGR
ncbi:hypothetical protein FRX31_033781 [Thalictrum thalictroides]|uniref:Uncharacterized protein n=1 Tax=Thalictrum thalictroides TaxID=46969 RepID=A0A7J6UWT2_THATH|nr:hypothetical protein FRX31_033781 [Thalictrum thalictroides]